jgi:hypothetical protein
MARPHRLVAAGGRCLPPPPDAERPPEIDQPVRRQVGVTSWGAREFARCHDRGVAAKLRYRTDLYVGAAEYYDPFRPAYPAMLLDDLRARVPRVGVSGSPRSGTTATTLRSLCCSIERAACQRGLCHQRRGPRFRARPSHAADHGQGEQARHRAPRPTRVRYCGAVTVSDSTGAPPIGGSVRSASGPGSVPCTRTCCGPRSSLAALDAGVRLQDVQIAARHADPRTTTIYHRRRQAFDRHAAYVVVAFVAGR